MVAGPSKVLSNVNLALKLQLSAVAGDEIKRKTQRMKLQSKSFKLTACKKMKTVYVWAGLCGSEMHETSYECGFRNSYCNGGTW